MEWISVKDRLPEIDRRVLIYDRIEKCTYMSSLDKFGYFHVGYIAYRLFVTHWAELPEPPKEV